MTCQAKPGRLAFGQSRRVDIEYQIEVNLISNQLDDQGASSPLDPRKGDIEERSEGRRPSFARKYHLDGGVVRSLCCEAAVERTGGQAAPLPKGA